MPILVRAPLALIVFGLIGILLMLAVIMEHFPAVWNAVTQRRHELTSMRIRVTAETLKKQITMSKQLDFLKLPHHRAILNNEIPLSIGGGIGQSRTLILLLRKAHLGEVSVTVWPKILKEMCAGKNIFVLE